MILDNIGMKKMISLKEFATKWGLEKINENCYIGKCPICKTKGFRADTLGSGNGVLWFYCTECPGAGIRSTYTPAWKEYLLSMEQDDKQHDTQQKDDWRTNPALAPKRGIARRNLFILAGTYISVKSATLIKLCVCLNAE